MPHGLFGNLLLEKTIYVLRVVHVNAVGIIRKKVK